MDGKVGSATLELGFCLEIYSNGFVNKSVQNHPKSFSNIAEFWNIQR